MSSISEFLSTRLKSTVNTAGYVNLDGCITIGDAIRRILDNTENNKGDSTAEKHAGRQGESTIFPLKHLIIQHCNTKQDEYIDPKDIEKRQEIFQREAKAKARDTVLQGTLFDILCGENTITPFENEDVVHAKLKQALVEANRENLNLAPTIAFVAKNLEIYRKGLERIQEGIPTEESLDFANSVTIKGGKDRIEPQISIHTARELLARMPRVLIQLSQLENIDFQYAKNSNGEGYPIIPVPIFNEQGDFDGGVIQLKPSDFPRIKGREFTHYRKGIPTTEIAPEDDHPHRIIVGVSKGSSIFPTPIPVTLSDNKEAIEMYQVCVFLHEFFHTVESQHRTYDRNSRNTITLQYNNENFTLQDWWEEWENLLLSGEESSPVSNYAATYMNKLTEAMRLQGKGGDWKFEYAVGEQMAESFVAYMLNIQTNPGGWTDFQSESFGNTAQLEKYQSGESPAANQKWLLMNKLCQSTIIY